MRFAIYSRKSVLTGRGESIENQVELCRSYLAAHYPGVRPEEVAVSEDEGFSGKDFPDVYKRQLLSDGLFWVQDRLSDLFAYLNAPAWLHGALVLGVYRVLAWVVSVMLPPMAIFLSLIHI